VNEKYEDFAATYGPAGFRIIRCAGDYTDETGLFLSGRFDLAVFDLRDVSWLNSRGPAHIKKLGAIVLDEAQFITDPTRGISVELLLTLVLSAKSQGVQHRSLLFRR